LCSMGCLCLLECRADHHPPAPPRDMRSFGALRLAGALLLGTADWMGVARTPQPVPTSAAVPMSPSLWATVMGQPEGAGSGDARSREKVGISVRPCPPLWSPLWTDMFVPGGKIP